MDEDPDGENITRPGRQENRLTTGKNSFSYTSGNHRKSRQQPGRSLCVDTRNEQFVNTAYSQPNSSFPYNYSTFGTRSKHFHKDVQHKGRRKSKLRAEKNTTVEPNSHCKLKTTLAVEYVRGILAKTAVNSRPISHRNSVKKNGQLKPLLGTENLAFEPNVTKCLGIQNDRQKKTFTLEDGSEVREEVVTPDIARFSSATKQISQPTLTVDLRKLSLADQTETSENSFTCEEPQKNRLQGAMKIPKRFLIYRKNIDSNQMDKNTDDKDDPDFSDKHGTDHDHNDEETDNLVINAVGSTNFRPNYNQYYRCGINETEYINDDNPEYPDYCDHIDNASIDNNVDVDDHLFTEKTDINQQLNLRKLLVNGVLKGFEDDGKNDKAFNNEKILTEESTPKPHQKLTENVKSSHNPTVFLRERTFPTKNFKISDENKSVYRELILKYSSNEEKSLLDSKPVECSKGDIDEKSSTDQDSVQVKYIWKALVDGGFDISREEISKYKVNTKKSRIKSAPAFRRCSQTANVFTPNVPSRPKSAVNQVEQDRSRKACLPDREDDSTSKINSLKVGSFTQEREKGQHTQKWPCNDKSNLEIVAVSKPVTKLLRKTNTPLKPPFNFPINTIPKSGHFFYFTYGLNMNQKRLKIQLKCQIGIRYWGVLFGFKLLFNKKGSAEGGVGFPNIAYEPGFSVEGCVYELSLDCLPLLDVCVGFPKHYSRMVVPVWMCNSLNPIEHGVAQHCVPAVVYVAQDKWLASDPTALDTSFTLTQCVLGTDLLTSNYRTFLERCKF